MSPMTRKNWCTLVIKKCVRVLLLCKQP